MATKPISANISDIRNKPKINNVKPINSKPLTAHDLVKKTHPIDAANNRADNIKYAVIDKVKEAEGTYTITENGIYDIGKFKYADVNVPTHGGDVDPYEGEYTVTPKTFEQTLQTENKLMEEDVTVLSIPYFETSNPQNGYTVYIGEH